MAETGAPLAGEMSGHIFFADRYYGFDDAVYVAVRLLGILARTAQSLAEMRDALPAVVQHARVALAVRARRANSRWSSEVASGCGGAAPRSPTSTACACEPATAGGCCAPRTPRR